MLHNSCWVSRSAVALSCLRPCLWRWRSSLPVDSFLRCRVIDNERPYEHLKVRGERVDAVVQEDVALLKMDVEGFEFHALEVFPPCLLSSVLLWSSRLSPHSSPLRSQHLVFLRPDWRHVCLVVELGCAEANHRHLLPGQVRT